MTALDIEAALTAAPPSTVGDRCKIQRWLDSIPEDAPGKTALEAAFNTEDVRSPHYRSYDQLLAIAARLGCSTSDKTVAAHRKRMCRCTW